MLELKSDHVCKRGRRWLMHLVNILRPKQNNLLRRKQNGRRHFQIRFLEWRLLYFYWNLLEIFCKGSVNKNWSRLRHGAEQLTQAVIWTNGGLVYWRIYTSSGLDYLTVFIRVVSLALGPSCQYRKSHCGDKTIFRSSYLHNGISHTDKTTSLYWIRDLMIVPVPAKCPWRIWIESTTDKPQQNKPIHERCKKFA